MSFASGRAILRQIATRSLEANIVQTGEGLFLAAGAHQFRSFWTRDFCFAVRGLLAIDRGDVVENHLSRLLRDIDRDGLVPRIVDNVPSWRRVVTHTALRWLPAGLKASLSPLSSRAPIRAEHRGEHGTISIDSNALVLISALDFFRHTGNHQWLESHRGSLQRVVEFCLARSNNATSLVEQGRFEDWQDSASRQGKTLYVNLLFARAFAAARELGLRIPAVNDGFLDLIRRDFFLPDSGVFKSHADLDVVSLDGNLMILNEDSLEVLRGDLYRSLKRHPLWSMAGIPGVATIGNYPPRWISWTTKIVGLRHYHDRFVWSWLSAQAAKAASLAGDVNEAERIFTELAAMATRDEGIGEVYEPRSRQLVANFLYRSECPFSWGAGCVLEALASHEAIRR